MSSKKPLRIALTGGPGAGKTATLEFVRHTLSSHVHVVREAASIVFLGGFPREQSITARCAAQRAIFHVQRELETIAASEDGVRAILCDRGTIDGAAYWPAENREADFFRDVGTTRRDELARYHAVIHLHPPSARDGYEHRGVRIETAQEAQRIDARIARAWRGHPRLYEVPGSHDFVRKLTVVDDILRALLADGFEEPAPTMHAMHDRAAPAAKRAVIA